MDAQGHLRLMESAMEEWRPVVGYEGLYEVSSEGRVRSLGRDMIKSNGVRGSWPTKVLRTHFHKQSKNYGRVQVALRRDEKTKTFYVHRLVAEAFLGPKPDGFEVCHKNNDTTDNRVSNLMYGTKELNLSHQAGRCLGNKRKKLTEALVLAIRSGAISGADAARESGCALNTIWAAKYGHTWRHLP